jgi:predicted transposase/invertase (TIGR01784 family)
MCQVNPRVDFAFKKLFGSEENKDLLLSLINAVVSEEDQAEDIELRNPYNLADYQAGKMSVLDVKAVDRKGRWYNVEMQISQDLHFEKRAIYYWAKLVTEQLSEGMMFKELRKTISINILGFNFILDNSNHHNVYRITNVTTGEDDRFHDTFELHYIELKKFRKQYEDLVYPLDRWITFLTKAHELAGKKQLPRILADDQDILKAMDAVGRMFNPEERLIYEVRMQAVLDVESKIASAEEIGLAKGLEQGLEQGRTEGIAQGLEQGLQKGIVQGMAQSLLTILSARYGVLPEAVTQQVQQADCAQIQHWMGKIVTTTSLEELLASSVDKP